MPITNVHSPVAYAIIAETHWYSSDVSHGGMESVLRYFQQTAYIIGGRACTNCRILHKNGIQVDMAPVGGNNLLFMSS